MANPQWKTAYLPENSTKITMTETQSITEAVVHLLIWGQFVRLSFY